MTQEFLNVFLGQNVIGLRYSERAAGMRARNEFLIHVLNHKIRVLKFYRVKMMS